MKVYQKKPKIIIPQEHLQVAQKAQEQIDSLRQQLSIHVMHRDEVEAKLRERSSREVERNERRAQAFQAREQAREHFEQIAVEAEIDPGRANDYLEADRALREAEKQLSIVMRRCDFEESWENDESANQQKSVNHDTAQIAKLEGQIARYEAARDKSLAAHGEQEAKLLSLNFQQLQDQEAAARETLESIERQRSALEQEASVRLQDYPEHLREIHKQFVPVEDATTELVEALLTWREIVLNDDTIRLVEQHAIPLHWLAVNMEAEPAQWRAKNSDDIRKWLQDYRERHE